MRPLPVFSSAVSATSRLNAPLIDPSARPIADDARRGRQVDGRRRVVVRAAVPPRIGAPALRACRRRGRRSMPLFGNARPVVLPICRVGAAVEAPLDADRAGEVARGLDDARFDLDLRLRPVERADQRCARSAGDRAGP